MTARDLFTLAFSSVRAHRLRSALTVLGIVIGVTAVILLTSLGEGTRQFILSEFTQFGTNLLAVNPGRVETSGLPGAIGNTVRKLTLEEAEAIARLPGVEAIVPLVFGMAEVEHEERGRSVFVYGGNHAIPEVWKFAVRQGRFLPEGDLSRARAVAVLGPKLKRELFDEANALGEHVRVAGRRFLVVGVMEPKGQFLGIDLDDSVYIPVASAQSLFNRDELIEIDVLFSEGIAPERIEERVRSLLVERHDGEEDFTITTQTEMLDVLGRVLGIVNVAVGGIGGISLVVGAIGILTMMWISVGERTGEIGLAKAIGATRRQILALFMVEATLLSVVGGASGVALGLAIVATSRALVPALPVEVPAAFVVAALVVSVVVGLLSGVLPARRAARLDPVDALHAE